MERIDIVKEDKTKSNIKKLINKAEKPSNSVWDKKDPLEEALRKSDDELLAKAIQELLNKDLLH
jgi:arsenate reductase-like glutaredoxin family protein